MKLFWKILLFMCCLASLLVSMQIFYNQGIVADEFNLGFSQLFSGNFWLAMSWLRLFVLLIAAILSFMNLLSLKKSTV